MDRLFANLSPEELYEHLQSLDDGERTIRVVRISVNVTAHFANNVTGGFTRLRGV